jgi:hypothetical protein
MEEASKKLQNILSQTFLNFFSELVLNRTWTASLPWNAHCLQNAFYFPVWNTIIGLGFCVFYGKWWPLKFREGMSCDPCFEQNFLWSLWKEFNVTVRNCTPSPPVTWTCEICPVVKISHKKAVYSPWCNLSEWPKIMVAVLFCSFTTCI